MEKFTELPYLEKHREGGRVSTTARLHKNRLAQKRDKSRHEGEAKLKFSCFPNAVSSYTASA